MRSDAKDSHMLSSHLVSVGGDRWSLWRWCWLRGAGLPSSWSAELGSASLMALLDDLHRSELAVLDATEHTIAACQRVIQSEPHAIANRAEVVLRSLAKGKIPTHDISSATVDEPLRALRTRDAVLQAVRSHTLSALASEQDRCSQKLADYCNASRLREALTWQNRSALKNSADRIATTAPDDRSSKARERRRVVARYVQRYTLKNDTIGFFGPVAWATFDHQVQGLALQVGPLTTIRQAHFEDWAIHALAEQLTFSPELLSVCSLRIKPFSWIEGNTLFRPPAEPRPLSDAEVLVLELARDVHTIDEIITRAIELGGGLIESREHGFTIVRAIVKAGLAVSQIELPAEVGRKELHLQALLEAAPACEARTEALSQLGQLQADLAAIHAAAGDGPALDRAIDALEASFTQITSRAVKRGHGQVYAGRQIFFEDCLRGGELTVGRAVLDSIGAPLSLMLISARWFTFEVARRYRAAFTKRYAALVRKDGDPRVPLGAFLIGTADLFAHQNREVSPIVAEVRDELRRRWDQIIPIDGDAKRVQIRSDQCRDRVAELFPAPCPGWPTARYHAPDVLIAAATADDVSAGNFLTVLGELHAGVNTLLARCAFTLHPDRAGVEAACVEDVVSPCITPVQPTADRTSTIVWAPNGLHVELAQARSWRARDQVFAGGDLYVIEDGGVLEVRSRTRDARFDIIRFMDHYLSAEASPHFRVFREARHLPRVTLDNLVISRERWSLQRADITALLAGEGNREAQFLAVNKWARDLGLPRFVFVVVSNEAKPFYVDFASPIYVELFLKFVARAQTVQVSEMLPAHGEHWLEDEQGEHYSSELRIAAVDPVPWSVESSAG
ncbi:MAG TPA: lantibiotic dehydratase [Kofleriaceae bacterium]